MQRRDHNTETVPWVYLQCKKTPASYKCGNLFNQVFVTEGRHLFLLGRMKQGLIETKGRVLLTHESCNFFYIKELNVHCFSEIYSKLSFNISLIDLWGEITHISNNRNSFGFMSDEQGGYQSDQNS